MDENILKQLVGEGLSEREIAKRIRKSASTTHRWLKQCGLATNHPLYNEGGGEYRCERCGEANPDKFFGHKKSLCKKCFGKFQHSKWRQNKRILVRYKGGECKKCGYNRCSAALDFHHPDPKEKDPSWRKMRAWALEKIKPEIDKCVLLCCRCHREEHHGIDEENFSEDG